MLLHPRFRTLCRYVEGDLVQRQRSRIAEHLAKCTRCRGEFSFLRELETAAQEEGRQNGPLSEVPGDRSRELETILARRAAGERVILPVSSRLPRPSRDVTLPRMAAAAALLAVAASWLIWSPEVSASKSELRFRPQSPQPGAVIEVEYVAGSLLQGEDSLRLRARFRTAEDADYNYGPRQSTTAVLFREDDRIYKGSFVLPESVVYGAFAVEDMRGERVDHNGRRLWELIVHGRDGRPLYEALQQRIRDLMGRNWELAFQTVRMKTELYPDRPDVWKSLAIFERWVLGRDTEDSLRSSHEARFTHFHNRLSDQVELPADFLFGIWSYAFAGGDSVTRQYWADRFKRDFPDDPRVLFWRAGELSRQHYEAGTPDRYLEELEDLWRKVVAKDTETSGLIATQLVYSALNRAADANDPSWFVHWMRRYSEDPQFMPSAVSYRVRPIIDREDMREAGMQFLREALAMLERNPSEYRLLINTVAEQTLEDRVRIVETLQLLGKGQLLSGDTIAAIDTLRAAAAKDWSPAIFRTLVDVQLALGDTASALRNLARVSIDPGTKVSFTDSVFSRFAVDVEAWRSWNASAHAEMRDKVMARARMWRPKGAIRLSDRAGNSHSLDALSSNTVTVVAFWSRFCGPSVARLPRLQEYLKVLEERGVRVVTITDEQPSEELDEFLREQAFELPVYYDLRSEARKAFDKFTTPDHFVLDASGVVVFSHSQEEELPRQVEALLPFKPDPR